MGMEKYTLNRARFFVRKKCTTFSTEQNQQISPKGYDFAANYLLSWPLYVSLLQTQGPWATSLT
jgi:hypothetical protein